MPAITIPIAHGTKARGWSCAKANSLSKVCSHWNRSSRGVFRVPAQEVDVDRVVFDTIVDGRAMRVTYSGIEFFRAWTP